MESSICTMLFTFIISFNFNELWAANDPAHQLRPPGPGQLSGYRDGFMLYDQGKQLGPVYNGKILPPGTSLVGPSRWFPPQGALVYNYEGGLVGRIVGDKIVGHRKVKMGNAEMKLPVNVSPQDGYAAKFNGDRVGVVIDKMWFRLIVV